MSWNLTENISEVSPGTFFVQGPASNWTIVREAEGQGAARFFLVDTGYPGDRERLLESISSCGLALADCLGVVVTHAHSDHIGSAQFLAEQGIPLYAHPLELANLRRQVTEQVTLADFGWRIVLPRVLRWMTHAVRAGGLGDVAVAAPRELSEEVLQSLPGSPQLVLTGAHTSGHCALYFPGSQLLLSGDLVISGHPLSQWQGLQTLPKLFHHAPGEIECGIERLQGLEVSTLLPGHGPYLRLAENWRDDIREADYWPYG